jgi:hypothetical protein
MAVLVEGTSARLLRILHIFPAKTAGFIAHDAF